MSEASHTATTMSESARSGELTEHQRQALVDDSLLRMEDARRADERRPVNLLMTALMIEVDRQDEKHGPFEGTPLGRSRLAIACLEDEIAEVREAWRSERKSPSWDDTRTEVMQVAAVAIRALRDAL